MKILRTIEEVRSVLKEARRAGKTIGLVPTMGALHAGHLSLVQAARAKADIVVATIFINPTQFAPGEDFDSYPRTFENDCKLLEDAAVDILFAPSTETMYPSGATTFVDVPALGERLDGASRPGHFRGVATIVTKLFHIVHPDYAFFGQKDAAQVAVLQAMVRDLNFDLELVVCPTVREKDGLALSSRNRYLSASERHTALALLESLSEAEWLVARSEFASKTLREAMQHRIEATPNVRLDYAEVVDANTLLPIEDAADGALIAIAAWVGNTRLIDNILIPTRSAR
jgi:pantoate--beta-alanine ligase